MTARTFVGREAQLAELEAALSDAAAGQPSLVLVAGEPGLGKTRLLSELQRRVRDDGRARVLAGDCLSLGEGEELPYAPLVTALRPLARTGEPVLDELPEATRQPLATLVPALAGGAGPAFGAGDPTAQARVFEALLELLDRLSADLPVVLMLEDLHWADASTRAFLRFLSVNLCGERVVVLGSYRPDELHRRHPLRALLAELDRDPRSRRLTLDPLTRDELAAQLRDILGAEADPALVDRLHRRGEGNPLFTEELLAAGMDGRGALPPTLRDALDVRVGRLGEATQELLRLLSVAGSADHATLVAGSGMPSAELRAALRDAIDAHILAVDEDDRYRFRHALLREAVADDLLPGERAELHLVLARALEAAPAPDRGVHRATAVAHHYQAAGDQPAALQAAVRAASAAEGVHAYGEAAALLDRALELWDRVPDPESVTGTTRVLLLERAASAENSEGDHAREATLLDRALELTGEGDPLTASRLLERLARARWQLNRQHDTLSTLDHSLALLPADAGAERAWRMAAKARFLMLMGHFRESAATAREAVEQAQLTGERRPEGRALNALGVSLMGLGDPEAGAEALRRALALAHQDGELSDIAAASVNLADILHLSGRTEEAIGIAQAAREQVAALGREYAWLSLAVAEQQIDAGRWDEAAEIVRAVGRRYQGTTLVNAMLRAAELALGRGQDAEAAEALDRAVRAAEGSREPQFIGVLCALNAARAARGGDLEGARAAIEDGLDRIEFCTEDVHRITRLAAAGVRVEADIAQRARDLGDERAERDAQRRAEALLERVAAAGGPDADADARPVERAHWHTAVAEMSRADGVPTPEAWGRAAAAWDAVQRPYAAARARWRQAEALVLVGDRDGATAALAEALAVAERLDAGWLRGELTALAARARLPVGGAAAVPETAAVGTSAQDPFGLTERERQVLAIVAGGATNREVGARLFMAEKTASVHVSRILAKLDVRTRTEAAAVAHRLGLAEE